MAFTAERHVQIGFSLLFLVLCVIGVMSYYSVTRLREDADWISHTHEVIASINSIGSDVANAVSAERGFALTGDKAYLEQYGAAARAVEAGLGALERLVADNPAQVERLKNVTPLVTERMAFARGVNEIYSGKGVDAVRAELAKGTGRALSIRIAAALDELEAAERGLLSERNAQIERVTTRTKAVILAGGALALASLALALYLFSRDFAGRRRADAALHTSMNDLETGVRDRTTELAQANKDLLDGAERLTGVIESAMDAIITVDEAQKITIFNAAAERIFGCPAAEALGGPLDRFIPERFREAHRGHVERFGQTGATSRRMGARLPLYGLRRDGGEFPIDASISQVHAGAHRLYTVILRDVTEARKAENDLQLAYHARRTANEQLLGIIQSAMDAIITIDAGQRIVVFNQTAAKMFRCRAEEAIGSPLERFIPQRFHAAHRGHVERFGETRVTAREMGARLDLFGLRADGEEFPIDASISQVTVDGERFYTVILRDVSERRRAEEALERSYGELRELSRVMNEVREAERTRVARELHDELAQWLTALKMDIAWLSARLPAGDGGVLDRTERMKKVVDTTVASVRRIAADLRPVMLDDLGLVPSIEHLLQSVAERANLAVTLDVPADGFDFRDPLATAVYRMVQEALTNVARHAGATEVRVTLAREGDALLVRVADNGVGLRPPAGDRKSYGLLGIRERAQTLGGDARIYSPAEGGTVVEIRIPLARYTEAGAVA